MGKRKKDDGGGGGGYNWMDTYGDLVTLLLCFFVLLFASSSVDASKYEQMVLSLSGAVSPIAFALDPGPANLELTVQPPLDATPTPPSEEGISVTPPPIRQDEVDEEFNELYNALLAYVDNEGINDIEVNHDGRQISIRFSDHIFFDTGEDVLKPESIAIIDEIVPFLEDYIDVIRIIRIEGHTDDVPISTSKYQNNWWLSMGRAGNVLQYLHDTASLSPQKLSADGRGEYNPIADNATEEGRAQNRRVEFVIEEIEVAYDY